MDHQNTPRGEGFELRTDSYGAIRGGKGIFITADEQLKAMGATVEMDPANQLLGSAVVQLNDWQEIARTHYNTPPDVSTLKQFVGKAVNGEPRPADERAERHRHRDGGNDAATEW